MNWEMYHQADFIHNCSSIVEIIWEILECMCGFVFYLHVCVVMCVVLMWESQINVSVFLHCSPSYF